MWTIKIKTNCLSVYTDLIFSQLIKFEMTKKIGDIWFLDHEIQCVNENISQFRDLKKSGNFQLHV